MTPMPKCPRCKSKTLMLFELWINHSICFEVTDGVIDTEGVLREGQPYKVEAECGKCGYLWTLRGVRQVGELEGWWEAAQKPVATA